MRRLLLAAGMALVLHGLLLSTDTGWMKKKGIHHFRLEPLAITISYKQKAEKKPSDEKIFEEIKKIPTHTQKKTINKPETPKPHKEIKKTILPKNKKPPKKIKATPQKIIEPSSKDIPEPILDPTPEWPHEEQRIFKEDLEVSGVPKEMESKKAIMKEKQDEPSEPISSPIREAIPVYRKNPTPKYPRMARRRGHEGTVVMEVLVNRDGRVEDLRLYESSGYPMLDRSAMDSVKNWLFYPGKRGDKEVDMWVKVPVRFQLK